MKFLKQFLFTIVALVGLSLSVAAQKDNDQKKPPPKDPPPKIKPGGDKPPKGDDKPKKPGMSYIILGTAEETRAE